MNKHGNMPDDVRPSDDVKPEDIGDIQTGDGAKADDGADVAPKPETEDLPKPPATEDVDTKPKKAPKPPPRPPKKKGYGKVTTCCLILLAILAGLFLDFGGFGSGLGLPTLQTQVTGNGGEQVDEPAPAQELPDEHEAEEPPLEEEPQPQPQNTILIRVVENTIYFDGEAVSAQALQEIISNRDLQGYTWFLESERAVLATIEEVRSLLRDANIDFVDVIA